MRTSSFPGINDCVCSCLGDSGLLGGSAREVESKFLDRAAVAGRAAHPLRSHLMTGHVRGLACLSCLERLESLEAMPNVGLLPVLVVIHEQGYATFVDICGIR